jgi:hypothetical protein
MGTGLVEKMPRWSEKMEKEARLGLFCPSLGSLVAVTDRKTGIHGEMPILSR